MNLNNNSLRHEPGSARAVKVIACACVCLLVILVPSVAAQAKSSAAGIELQELKTALTVSQKQLAEEKIRFAALNETRKALAESFS